MAPGPPGRRRVAVVDDDPDARAACVTVLANTSWDLREYETARAAIVAASRGTLPEIVLMDMSLPGESAPLAMREILRHAPTAAIVVLSSFQRESFVFDALRAGAVGYLLKQHALEQLADTLAIVAAGGSPMTPSIARRVLTTFREASPPDGLSDREQDVLQRFAEGHSYAEAADALGISIDTVRTHVRRMYKKLHVETRTEAVLAGVRRGLLR